MTNEDLPHNMTQSDVNEISLADIFRFFKENLKVMVALAVLGAAIGVGSTFAIHKRWEGTVTMQIGRAAGSSTESAEGSLIEPSSQTVGRIQLNAFRDKVMADVFPEIKNDLTALRKTVAWSGLKARAVPGTTYIELTARTSSPEQVEQVLAAASRRVEIEHAAILERSRALPKQQLGVIDAAIDSNIQTQEQLVTALAHSKNSDSLVALGALQSSRTERALLNYSRFRISQLLSPDKSYNTRVISDIQVDQNAVFPRKLYFGLGGLVLGAAAGVLFGIFRTLRSRTA